MNLLPYRKLVIRTPLQPAEAAKRLRENVFTHSPPIGYLRGPRDFYARIHDTQFTVNRLLDYRNSFLPILHGKFVPVVEGTEIQVDMYPPLINLVLAGLLMGLLLFSIVRTLIINPIDSQTLGAILPLLLMSGFVYALSLGSFLPEAKRAEDFLRGIYPA